MARMIELGSEGCLSFRQLDQGVVELEDVLANSRYEGSTVKEVTAKDTEVEGDRYEGSTEKKGTVEGSEVVARSVNSRNSKANQK